MQIKYLNGQKEKKSKHGREEQRYGRLYLTAPVLHTRCSLSGTGILLGLPKDLPRGTQARILLRESILRPSSCLCTLLKLIYLKNVLPVTMTLPLPFPFRIYLQDSVFTIERHTSHHLVSYQGAPNFEKHLRNKRTI